jgi:prophage regulatory protein
MLEAAVKEIATKTVSDLLGIDNKSSTRLLAASLREMLLRIETVCAITGLSTPTIYREMARGGFPRPVRITGHARAWKLSEVTAWIDSRTRDGGDVPAQNAAA